MPCMCSRTGRTASAWPKARGTRRTGQRWPRPGFANAQKPEGGCPRALVARATVLAHAADGLGKPLPPAFTLIACCCDPAGVRGRAYRCERVVERLEGRGYTVMAPANPLRGLYSDSTYIASVLDSIKGPLVLVGHSYGGALISSAAAGNPCEVPGVRLGADARRGREWHVPGRQVPQRTRHRHEVRPLPGRRRRQRDRPLPQARQTPAGLRRRPAGERHEGHGGDPTARGHDRVLGEGQGGRLETHSVVVPRREAGQDHQDKTINPDQERFEAKRAGSHTVEIDSSHVAMIAHPEAVTDLVLQAATAAESARPALATTGSPHDARPETALTGIAAASLIAGAGALLLGRRLRRPAL
ncbi:alpha/beta fold hydrolase [Streptomyces sp. NPDC054786]